MHSVTSNAVYPIKEKADNLYYSNSLYLVKYLPIVPWQVLPSQSNDDNVYFKEWIDFLYNGGFFSTDSTVVYLGSVNPNYLGMVWGFTYGGSDLYNWCIFYYIKPDSPMRRFGYRNGVWFLDTVA